MKTIGLIGGMSWESSAVYYILANNSLSLEDNTLECKLLLSKPPIFSTKLN